MAVPNWLPRKEAAYYLYFSSHRNGRYIRLAMADDPAGPWRFAGEEAVRVVHPLSPQPRTFWGAEVIRDDERREFRMYVNLRFRSADPRNRRSGTYVAVSKDGREFVVTGDRIGPTYSRALLLDGATFLFMSSNGLLLKRSEDGVSGFVTRRLRVLPSREEAAGKPFSRHVALQRVGDVLRVFYTRKGDAPERILVGTIDLTDEWTRWRVHGDEEVLRPEPSYEGAELPIRPTRKGPAARDGEHALRNPAILTDHAGRTWLYYTIAGECGIAAAELKF